METEKVVQRWDDEAVLIDLSGFAVTRVHTRRSVGPALVLALFTLLTGAGLALSNGSPSAGGAGVDDRPSGGTRSSGGVSDADRSPAIPSTVPMSGSGRTGSASGLVAAGARAIRASDGTWTIRVSGVAERGVTAIEVLVRIGGSVAGHGMGRVDPAVALPVDDGRISGALAPWSADIPLARDQSTQGGDSVAIIDVRWLTESAHPAGETGLVVTLGDGRATE